MKFPGLNAAQTFTTLTLASIPAGQVRDAMVATHETGKPTPVGPFTLRAGDGMTYDTERWWITQ